MVIVETVKEFLKSELSVWSISKSRDDRKYAAIHPSVMPVEVAKKILELTLEEPLREKWVLDPMVGVGSVCVAALRLHANSVGIDVSKKFVQIAKSRVRQELSAYMNGKLDNYKPKCKLVCGDARTLDKHVKNLKVDVCVTSPPYFAIMHGCQTFTTRRSRPYTCKEKDLGNIFRYKDFLSELRTIYIKVFNVLKSGGWFVPVVGDVNILKSNFPEETGKEVGLEGRRHLFFPVHVDVVNMLRELGFEIHSIVDWDRRQDYNYLHSIGWSKEASKRWFMTIRVNEYVIFARKPLSS